jgi:hypothetical protein
VNRLQAAACAGFGLGFGLLVAGLILGALTGWPT